MFLLLITLLSIHVTLNKNEIFLPVNTAEQGQLQLTDIGLFAAERSARPGIPAHLHTGIDIKRPGTNYKNELIYPVARGLVISRRDDGPYAQLICEHILNDLCFWTVYEHIAGIMVHVGDSLDPHMPVARFMNRDELNRHGWQFDHFHLEILKVKPLAIQNDSHNPQRFFGSFTLQMYDAEQLHKHFYDPLDFLKNHIQK